MANMKHERLSNNQSLSEASSSSLRMASWMFLGMMRFFLVSCQNVCRFCSGNIESDLKYISLPSRSFQQVPRSPRKHTQWHRSNRYPWSKKIVRLLLFQVESRVRISKQFSTLAYKMPKTWSWWTLWTQWFGEKIMRPVRIFLHAWVCWGALELLLMDDGLQWITADCWGRMIDSKIYTYSVARRLFA